MEKLSKKDLFRPSYHATVRTVSYTAIHKGFKSKATLL